MERLQEIKPPSLGSPPNEVNKRFSKEATFNFNSGEATPNKDQFLLRLLSKKLAYGSLVRRNHCDNKTTESLKVKTSHLGEKAIMWKTFCIT